MADTGIRPILCLVTDRSFQAADCFLDVIDAAISGGVNMVQFREKRDPLAPLALTDRECWELGRQVRDLCAERKVPFIVNDRFDLAMALDADGVHLGQGDLPVDVARRVWRKSALYGVSVHTLGEAAEALSLGASYLGFGAVFPTASKSNAVHTGLDSLAAIIRGVNLPVIAIGGISTANAPSVAASGCAGIAVISAILGDPDPASAARNLRDTLDSSRFPT